MPLRPEDSAQGSQARPNPLVAPSLARIGESFAHPRIIVDQGAGRLRHLNAFAGVADSLFLVDTPLQLTRSQRLLGERRRRVVEVAEDLRTKGWDVRTLSDEEFSLSALGAHAVLSICVYDAVLPADRARLAQAAARNLRVGGWYVVIVPRNDQSILRRFAAENALEDGHVFCRGESCTFYVNYREHSPLVRLIEDTGLRLFRDMSTYRQVWLFFEKT